MITRELISTVKDVLAETNFVARDNGILTERQIKTLNALLLTAVDYLTSDADTGFLDVAEDELYDYYNGQRDTELDGVLEELCEGLYYALR